MAQYASGSGWHYMSQQQSEPESNKQTPKEPSPKEKKRQSKSSRKERHSLKSADRDRNNSPTCPSSRSEGFIKVPQTEERSSPTKEKKKTRGRKTTSKKTSSKKTTSSSSLRDSRDLDLDSAIRPSLAEGKSASQTIKSTSSPTRAKKKKHKSRKRSSKSENREHSQTNSSREVEEDNRCVSRRRPRKKKPTGCARAIDPSSNIRMLEREQTGHDGTLHSAMCSDCKSSIQGARFMCITCESFDGCEACYRGHNTSHGFVKFADGISDPVPVPARTTPTTTNSTEDFREKHHGVFCDGAKCSLVTCIMGSRYVCADCPPSLDLCGECFDSGMAHDVSHTFKRFDKRPTVHQGGYTVCPPRTVHTNVFCDGFNCDGSTTCIIGVRYCCADCKHKSIDLCQSCYHSRRFHNPSHSFKRYKSQHAFDLLQPQVPQTATNQHIHHQGPQVIQPPHHNLIQPPHHNFHPNGASIFLNNSMASQPCSMNQQPTNGCFNSHSHHSSDNQENQHQQQLGNAIEHVVEFAQNFYEGYQQAQEYAESIAAMQQMAADFSDLFAGGDY